MYNQTKAEFSVFVVSHWLDETRTVICSAINRPVDTSLGIKVSFMTLPTDLRRFRPERKPAPSARLLKPSALSLADVLLLCPRLQSYDGKRASLEPAGFLVATDRKCNCD